MSKNTKYIFVTGGVTSSLGKGIISSSLALLLQARGYSVTIQKLDPYINIDPGTLNPYEHGECYVTQDGAETDLDLGHYERFLNINTSQANNITTGRIYQSVIQKERNGDFLGKTVQIIPHITDEIKSSIKILGDTGKYDIVITEIGGTIGDIESLPYIESVRQLRWELGAKNSMVIHLTLIPYLSIVSEHKTKPTQHSIKTLMASGIQADFLVCRAERPLPLETKKKLALFCNVELQAIIESLDVETIYDVPKMISKQKLDEKVLDHFVLSTEKKPDLQRWNSFLEKYKNPKNTVVIALVGKYTEVKDSYKSIIESFIHAGAESETKVIIKWISSETITQENAKENLSDVNGVLIPPGFGNRGIEGKIQAVKYSRENGIPLFGICLGMQICLIEFARNVLKLKDAHSIEMMSDTPHPVVNLMEGQKNIKNKGGTMRLGAWDCKILENTKAMEIYKSDIISERHRHRYEFNSSYIDDFTKNGMVISGVNPNTNLVEIIELAQHPWFIGVQFHPEYKSTVTTPHKLFLSFVEACLKYSSN
ncbi:CTP synthase [Ichthyobacterium seriolicida]|uniref:CTP synthase n=1 Tax=Ichthyobacterium seriolicida TaxID=242600 RepID=A0A1J1DZE6_9FLAO|nr:CTP synthase [Ichthyobacterium seriolicida]BAV94037.1 CTP synthase [Ichthyobacterium seriolicida]